MQNVVAVSVSALSTGFSATACRQQDTWQDSSVNEVVLLACARTPIGSLGGTLAAVTAVQLGAACIRAVLERARIPGEQVCSVIMGQVLSAGAGQAPARQAALAAGLSESTPTLTINKVCGSGMAALMLAALAIRAGESRLVVAGGQESMSQAPYLLPEARKGFRLGNQTVVDSLITDGLWDPYSNQHMGSLAEFCAKERGYSRDRQDAWAAESFRRALAAQQQGLFATEITPVTVSNVKGGSSTVASDEGPTKVDYARIPQLRAAFVTDGTVTAGNASTLNDGAAALVLAGSDKAHELGLVPVARLIASATHAQAPEWFTTAPAAAIRRALHLAGWQVADVDLFEINEAFAVVALAAMDDLGIPDHKLNVHGGAIALGHPLGASGARIVVTLIAALQATGKTRGVAAICIGGGEATAVCVELVA
jgi:acetyl-CoA C-acetyltransferase